MLCITGARVILLPRLDVAGSPLWRVVPRILIARQIHSVVRVERLVILLGTTTVLELADAHHLLKPMSHTSPDGPTGLIGHRNILVRIAAKVYLDAPVQDRFGGLPGSVAFEDDPVGVGRFLVMKIQGVVLGIYLASPHRLHLSLVGGFGLNIFYKDPC
jgi:hypothetical protein